MEEEWAAAGRVSCGEGACGVLRAGPREPGRAGGAQVGPAQVAGLGSLRGGVGGRLGSVEGLREGDSDGQVRGEQSSSPSKQTPSGCNGEGWVVVEKWQRSEPSAFCLLLSLFYWVKSVNSHL